MPFLRGPDGQVVRGPDGQPLHDASPPKAGSKRGARRTPAKPRLFDPVAAPTGDRESSPDKRVCFGRRLVRGPSPAYSRNKTSSRPALARHDTSTTDIDAYGPSDQLRAEETRATVTLNPSTDESDTDLKDILDETRRDNEVCRRVHELRAIVVDTAQSLVYANNGTVRKERCLEDLCGDVRNAQLVRYIGCLAQGGPKREESWRELLIDPECRVALVVGIIGTALKEHVFSELWFGGTDEQIEELEKLQERQKDGEGETAELRLSRESVVTDVL